MSDFQFNEDFNQGNNYNSEVKGITGFFIKIGLAKDVKQANIVMIVISILSFIGIFLLN